MRRLSKEARCRGSSGADRSPQLDGKESDEEAADASCEEEAVLRRGRAGHRRLCSSGGLSADADVPGPSPTEPGALSVAQEVQSLALSDLSLSDLQLESAARRQFSLQKTASLAMYRGSPSATASAQRRHLKLGDTSGRNGR